MLILEFDQTKSEVGIDKSEYDDICDHIIVKDLTNNTIVGTYRLLSNLKLPKDGQFVCETEFDIDESKAANVDRQKAPAWHPTDPKENFSEIKGKFSESRGKAEPGLDDFRVWDMLEEKSRRCHNEDENKDPDEINDDGPESDEASHDD